MLLRNTGFLRLLATRLTGAFGDGLLQAALASFVLFSPERQPTPLAIAVSFGILLLPYSLVGPFAGVFLDRWRRRQVLVRANWLRSVAVLLTMLVVLRGSEGLDLGLVVLVTLGVGRFVLAGVSAALPHVVEEERLVTANALAPTAGTIIYGIGILLGIVLGRSTGGGDTGVVFVLVAAAVVYLAAGLVPLTLGRDQLGPDHNQPTQTLRDVANGLTSGLKVLSADSASRNAVAVQLVHRFAFGVLTVVLLLLLRNTMNPGGDPDQALQDFSLVAAAVTAGALLAALLTPSLTRRVGTINWTSATLVIAAIAAPVSLGQLQLWTLCVGGLLIGLAQQSAKIGADTTLQRRIDDDHLGRVFSLFDVGVNIAIVLGALVVAIVWPEDGAWQIGFVLLGAVYLMTAIWYRHTRHRM
ncbi:MAG: MFS transporter [Micrococcales bacterium]|nr:MFS transporter [Micrococcales bacterium]